jgi:hypothetical protein
MTNALEPARALDTVIVRGLAEQPSERFASPCSSRSATG